MVGFSKGISHSSFQVKKEPESSLKIYFLCSFLIVCLAKGSFNVKYHMCILQSINNPFMRLSAAKSHSLKVFAILKKKNKLFVKTVIVLCLQFDWQETTAPTKGAS